MVGPRITATANPAIHQIDDIIDLTVNDMKKLTAAVDSLFVKNEKRLFSTEGASGGLKWKPLKKATLDAKKRSRSARSKIKKRASGAPLRPAVSLKIMQRTGELRKGLSTKGHPDHVAKWANLGSNAIIGIGVRNILPVYHGAVRGRRKNPRLPRRSVFQMKPQQRKGYYAILFKRFDLKRKQWQRAAQRGAVSMRRGVA